MNHLALIFMVAAGLTAGAGTADKRVALVVGNSNYINAAPLRAPSNDAVDVAAWAWT
jgi:hypothetical protein